MIDVSIQFNPATGELKYGHTDGLNLLMLLGIIEMTKSVAIQAATNPQKTSLIQSVRPDLRVT